MKIALLLAVLSVSLASLPAHAQATRTWVSGVGDDANPCSRTAPCKTFAGAISKTAAGGQINVLDPGGFGAVTITKAITINSEFVEAGVLVSGTNAIIINAGVNDRVVLRGLDIEGLGTGLNGIRFLAGASLHVQKCMIRNFRGAAPNGNGISFAPSGTSELFVDDCYHQQQRHRLNQWRHYHPAHRCRKRYGRHQPDLRRKQFKRHPCRWQFHHRPSDGQHPGQRLWRGIRIAVSPRTIRPRA